MPGVSVIIEGTTIGTVSDYEGKYSIEVEDDDVLVFSFIGYVTEKVPVSGKTTINMELMPDIIQLQEIVTVGYGTQKKKDLTGALGSVEGEEIAKRQVPNVSEALAGQIAGVNIIPGGGSPGTQPSIQIRGISSVTGNNSPLFVVDDIPVDDISYLDPKDIENIQVLKDASSASIYGARAGGGVILITTKSGTSDVLSFNVNARYGIQNALKTPDLANATEYARIVNEANQNEGREIVYPDPEALGEGTNWWDAISQSAPVYEFGFDLNKSNEVFNIRSGFNFIDQQGIIEGSDFQRINFSINTEVNLQENLQIGANIILSKNSETWGPDPVWDAHRVEPITPIYLPDYEQVGRNEFSVFSPTLSDVNNPVGAIKRNFSTVDFFRTFTNLHLKWSIIDGLDFMSRIGGYVSSWESNYFIPDYFIEEADKREVSFVSAEHNNRINLTWNNTLTFKRQWGDHDFSIMAGVITENFQHKKLYGEGNDLPGNQVDLRYLDAARTGFYSSGNLEEFASISMISRVTYGFKDRYLVTANFNRISSSIFPESNRTANFPGVSAAWVISEESFLKNNSVIDFLKVRAGYGQLGNQLTTNDINARFTDIAKEYYVQGAAQEIRVGAAPFNVGNEDLKWETVEDINLGINLSLLNHFDITLDVFQKNINDMLFERAIPSYLGSAFGRQWANIGEMSVKGWEWTTSYRNSWNGFDLNVSINMSRARSRMEKMFEGDQLLDGNHQRLNNMGFTFEGQTPGVFYGYVTDGVFQDMESVINHTDEFGNVLQPNAQPGDFRFRDLNNDGLLNDEDRQVIGNPEPDFNYGINISMGFKGVDLSMVFTGAQNFDVLNALRPYMEAGDGGYNAYAGVFDRAWRAENPNNEYPRLSVVDANQNFRYSDFYMEDGSFFRCRNIQLGYSLPEKYISKLSITNFRIYASMENPFVLSSFSGLDPEVGGSPTLRGVDWGYYPIPRTTNIGVSFTF